MVREPESTWRDWVAGDRAEKTLFVAEEGYCWLGVVGAFARVDPQEVQLISTRGSTRPRAGAGSRSA